MLIIRMIELVLFSGSKLETLKLVPCKCVKVILVKIINLCKKGELVILNLQNRLNVANVGIQDARFFLMYLHPNVDVGTETGS